VATLGLSVPVIVSERIHPPLMSLPMAYRMQRRLTYPFADAIVAQTETTAAWLRKRVFGADVAVIPNPVNFPLPRSEPIILPTAHVRPERRLVLWAGRLDRQKRPEMMIDAFATMARETEDWDLAMIGEGPLRAALTAQISALGLNDRIHLPGFVGNLGDWYNRANLYALTSSHEGFPNTLLEAMAHGLPCIAFDVPTGPAELGQGGTRLRLLQDSNHTAQLGFNLLDLAANTIARNVLMDAGRTVSKEYSSSAILAQWDVLITKVIENKR
jgi:glycosyltransferase involved in cell wall biosynthesis